MFESAKLKTEIPKHFIFIANLLPTPNKINELRYIYYIKVVVILEMLFLMFFLKSRLAKNIFKRKFNFHRAIFDIKVSIL